MRRRNKENIYLVKQNKDILKNKNIKYRPPMFWYSLEVIFAIDFEISNKVASEIEQILGVHCNLIRTEIRRFLVLDKLARESESVFFFRTFKILSSSSSNTASDKNQKNRDEIMLSSMIIKIGDECQQVVLHQKKLSFVNDDEGARNKNIPLGNKVLSLQMNKIDKKTKHKHIEMQFNVPYVRTDDTLFVRS